MLSPNGFVSWFCPHCGDEKIKKAGSKSSCIGCGKQFAWRDRVRMHHKNCLRSKNKLLMINFFRKLWGEQPYHQHVPRKKSVANAINPGGFKLNVKSSA